MSYAFFLCRIWPTTSNSQWIHLLRPCACGSATQEDPRQELAWLEVNPTRQDLLPFLEAALSDSECLEHPCSAMSTKIEKEHYQQAIVTVALLYLRSE